MVITDLEEHAAARRNLLHFFREDFLTIQTRVRNKTIIERKELISPSRANRQDTQSFLSYVRCLIRNKWYSSVDVGLSMGGALGKAADDIGGFLGNAVTAPFKTVLGRSCKDVCSGPWDVECFIEHFCIPDLIKLVMISALCFIIMMFLYLLFKVGICQCIVKSLCKMCFAACEMYWCTISDIIYFFWHKLKYTKRVNRRRRRRRIRDIEAATYSSSREDLSDGYKIGRSFSRKRSRERTVRRRRRSRSRRRRSSGRNYGHVRGRSGRKVGSPRKVQFSKGNTPERRVKSFKKRRIS